MKGLAIEVSKTNLIAQRDSCLKLSELYCEVIRFNQQTVSLQDQIKNLKGHLEKIENLDKSITVDLDSFDEKMKNIQTKLMGIRGQRRSRSD